MKENQSIDEFIEELTKTLEEMDLEKPIYGNKTGNFTVIIPNKKTKRIRM